MRGEEKNREEGEIGGKSREEGEKEKLAFREEGEIGSKSGEEREIGSESREKGDLPPCSTPSDMSFVKPDLSEITIPPIFCGCLPEKNTHLEHLDDTTDRYDTSWKVANTSNCNLIYNVGSQKRYNMDFL